MFRCKCGRIDQIRYSLKIMNMDMVFTWIHNMFMRNDTRRSCKKSLWMQTEYKNTDCETERLVPFIELYYKLAPEKLKIH